MKYRTIVADPPWRYTQKPTVRTGGGVSAEHIYPTLPTEDIAALPIEALAEPDAHLYMWVTNPVLLGQRTSIMGSVTPVEIVRGWGFEPKGLLTWIKGENGAGMGWFFRGDTEHVIFAVRGTLPIAAPVRASNVFRGAVSGHSRKPEAFLDLVERVSPGPYLELFARRQRLGWDTWGNEALNHLEIA